MAVVVVAALRVAHSPFRDFSLGLSLGILTGLLREGRVVLLRMKWDLVVKIGKRGIEVILVVGEGEGQLIGEGLVAELSIHENNK